MGYPDAVDRLAQALPHSGGHDVLACIILPDTISIVNSGDFRVVLSHSGNAVDMSLRSSQINDVVQFSSALNMQFARRHPDDEFMIICCPALLKAMPLQKVVDRVSQHLAATRCGELQLVHVVDKIIDECASAASNRGLNRTRSMTMILVVFEEEWLYEPEGYFGLRASLRPPCRSTMPGKPSKKTARDAKRQKRRHDAKTLEASCENGIRSLFQVVLTFFGVGKCATSVLDPVE